LYRKVKFYRKKFEQAKQELELTGKPVIMQVGERMKCNRRQVKSHEYFEQKFNKA